MPEPGSSTGAEADFQPYRPSTAPTQTAEQGSDHEHPEFVAVLHGHRSLGGAQLTCLQHSRRAGSPRLGGDSIECRWRDLDPGIATDPCDLPYQWPLAGASHTGVEVAEPSPRNVRSAKNWSPPGFSRNATTRSIPPHRQPRREHPVPGSRHGARLTVQRTCASTRAALPVRLPYTRRVPFRRILVLSLGVLLTPLAVVGCTAQGDGVKSECQVGGCTVTFDRGVNAQASLLGVKAELVAVNGNTVTLSVAGKQVSVPVGQTQPASGLDVAVQQVTNDKVVVRLSSGISNGN